MSAVRGRFHFLILAKRSVGVDAVKTLNGLDMFGMLPALASIGKDHLR
jgi:hypothetical protein